jgi:MYXO-CTERM domain-containing protein
MKAAPTMISHPATCPHLAATAPGGIPNHRHVLRSRSSHAIPAALLLFSSPCLPAAVVFDQIGDPLLYLLSLPEAPSISQIFTDFLEYSSMILEDFVVTGDDYEITRVSAIFQAQAGFAAFQGVDEFAVNIYSDPQIAASVLSGDFASLILSAGSAAQITQLVDPGLSGEFGLVELDLRIALPSAGTYWISVAPVSAVGVTGQFSLVHGGSAGGGAPGPAGSRWVNPGEGFGLGAISGLPHDYALSITAVPEPAGAALWLLSLAALFRRRRHSSQVS